MKRKFLLIALTGLVGCLAYDVSLEVTADVPERIDVSVVKKFDALEFSSKNYERDVVLRGGIEVTVKTNKATPFRIKLFSIVATH